MAARDKIDTDGNETPSFRLERVFSLSLPTFCTTRAPPATQFFDTRIEGRYLGDYFGNNGRRDRARNKTGNNRRNTCDKSPRRTTAVKLPSRMKRTAAQHEFRGSEEFSVAQLF